MDNVSTLSYALYMYDRVDNSEAYATETVVNNIYNALFIIWYIQVFGIYHLFYLSIIKKIYDDI